MSEAFDPIELEPPRFRPWRSATFGWLVTLVVLCAGVPLFLCMPPSIATTRDDLAARSLLHGGVQYRDIDSSDYPGIVWLVTGIRFAVGWGSVALRALDLAIVAVAIGLLLAWVQRAGGTAYALAWLAASTALFYPFISEVNHVRANSWVLLPALVAMWLRLDQVERAGEARSVLSILFEGIIWGAAVWIMPYIVAPAVAVWFVSARLIARREIWRGVLQDGFWLVVGGLLSLGAGCAWLAATGAWPSFVEVLQFWKLEIVSHVQSMRIDRLICSLLIFQPWGVLHIAALPMALLAFWESRLWSRRAADPARVWCSSSFYTPAETEPVSNARAFLAALYVASFAESIVLQSAQDYAHVPLLILAMAVIATHCWTFGFVYVLGFLLLGAVLSVPILGDRAGQLATRCPGLHLERHPLTNPGCVKLALRCFREGSTPELRDRTGRLVGTPDGTNWEELNDVVEFLRSVDPPLEVGKLNCWSESTLPLYLILDIDPPGYHPRLSRRLGADLHSTRAAEGVASRGERFVVIDLLPFAYESPGRSLQNAAGDPLQLPDWFPQPKRGQFPWNQPIIFRSGRYVVHKIDPPHPVIVDSTR